MAAKAERLGLLTTLVTFLLAGLTYGLARWAGGVSPLVAAAFLALAVLLSVVSYFHLRLVRRAQDEALEGETEEDGESLFTAPSEDNLETFTAEKALRQYERFIVPGFTIVLALLHLGLGLLLLRRLGDWEGLPPAKCAAIAALLASIGFVLFVSGKIQAAMAEEKDYRLLLAPAGYHLLCAATSLLAAAAAAATHFKIPILDKIVAWIGIAAMGIIAVEYLVTAILEIYRPRTSLEARPLYESRLCELLARPRGLLRSIAQAVDYQFGFHVSETWFYRLLERAVLPLIAVQLASLYLLSCFAFVAPNEEGIRERFGKPQQGRVLQPGLHLKFPWPIDKVVKFPAKQALRLELGHGEATPEDLAHEEDERVILWTRAHTHGREYWLMASREAAATRDSPVNASAAQPDAAAAAVEPGAAGAPSAPDQGAASDGLANGQEPPNAGAAGALAEAVPVNLASLHAVVQYHITDVFRYAYGFTNAAKILSDLAHRETVKLLVSADIFDLMGPKRLRLSEQLRQSLQKSADAVADGQGLGVEVHFVGIENAHPPLEVAASFENVVGALERAETAVLQAEAYRNRRVPEAEGEAARTVALAEGEKIRKVEVAKAEAEAFRHQLRAFALGGKVYRYRKALDHWERAVAAQGKQPGARKFLITSTKPRNVNVLNLEDKVRPDLLDLGLSASKE